jgi:acyl-CoA synthetase (AMP-forming)/AMP-acid ligase II
MNLVDAVRKWANLAPDRTVIVDSTTNRRITFAELLDRIIRLSNGFALLGLRKGDRVAVLSTNSIEYFEVYYACAMSGLIAQPINWRLSAEEITRIIEDGEPSVFVCQAEFLGLKNEVRASVQSDITYLEYGPGTDGSYERLVTSASPEDPAIDMHMDIGDADPVLILYTGGTTGLSKGALHTHHSLYMGMINQTVAERVVPGDVYMLTGQMFHIPVALAMNYIAHGCPCVLMNFDAKIALELIQKERVSAFLGITTMLNWMMAVEGFENYDISSLRNIQYGGGPMPETVVKAALKAFPCTIIQGYGQTEGMTMTFLSQEDHQKAVNGKHTERLNACGREGFVTRIRVVNTEGIDVPKDSATSGEIIVRSEANMLGYWRKPELTADIMKDGWMWTGDIATWDEDSYIFIVDRSKDMIISGGENIYSTQVESAIHKHEGVLECAVIGVPDDVWGEAVKAVVVMKPGESATEADIINTAREHLASYQKPKSVDFVDSLPKAPTGKILKRELRDPYWNRQHRKV